MDDSGHDLASELRSGGVARLHARIRAAVAGHPVLILTHESSEERCWERIVTAESDIAQTPPSTPWKIAIAAQLRREAAAPYGWIAQKLNLGNLNTLRSNVSRWQLLHPALA